MGKVQSGSEVRACSRGEASELREALYHLGYPRELGGRLEKALAGAGLRSYRAGETVMTRGEAAHETYVVRLGSVDVASEHAGRPRGLARFGEGGIVGEIGVLRSVPRSATVSASEDCELFVLDRETFGRVLSSSPEFRRRVEEIAEERRPRPR